MHMYIAVILSYSFDGDASRDPDDLEPSRVVMVEEPNQPADNDDESPFNLSLNLTPRSKVQLAQMPG